MPAIYYNRILDSAIRAEVRELDPNHKAPLTAFERAGLSMADQLKLDRLLAKTKVPLKAQGSRIDRAGRSVVNTYLHNLGRGDKRAHTDISTTVSRHNLVEPLFPKSIVPSGRECFDERLFELINNARRFIFLEGYELEREDLVDLLIEKARQGVQVAVLFDPVNEAFEKGKKSLLARMRAAAASDPAIKRHQSLKVAEFDTVTKGNFGFEQILHIKKTIADLPDGSMAEISGGINFGKGSSYNFDTAWYVEGVAALDSLNRFVGHFPRASGAQPPFTLDAVPTAATLQRLVTAKAQGRPMNILELAGAGQQRVELPRKYTLEQLQRLARVGRRIVISSRDVIKPGYAETLKLALHNGSWIKVVQQKMSAAQAAIFRAVADELKHAGAGIYKETARLHEESYVKLVYREIEAATEKRESIDVAAYCLSEEGLIQRLIAAKQAGCAVRVLVDDLSIDGLMINRKAIALLTAAGVEVKVFDPVTARALAHPDANAPANVKLHAKVIILGGERVLGGSANFTRQGFFTNVEDGRLVRSQNVARQFTAKLFEPLWQRCAVAEKLELVPEASRVPLLPPVAMDTPLNELVYVVLDLDTTGTSPRQDDRILSIAARAIRIGPRGAITELDEFGAHVTPGRDPIGGDFHVPGSAVRLHGLDNERLKALGAKRMREVMPELLAFLKRQQQHGKVVLVGHNLAFDLRFLDHTLARKPIAELPAVANATLDGPFIDTMHLSFKLSPRAAGHDLDTVATRLKVSKKRRPQHVTAEDVGLTGKILAAMLVKGGKRLTRLADLMGPDLFAFAGPVQLAETAGGPARYVLEELASGGLYLRSTDADGSLGRPRRVTDYAIDSISPDGEQFGLRLTVGYGAGCRQLKLCAPTDVLRFRAPGAAFYRLREAGKKLDKPEVLLSL